MEYPLAQALYQRTRQRAFVLAFEARRLALDAAVMAVAVLLALASIGCAVAALWLMLVPQIGAAGAALSVALTLFGASVATLLVRRYLVRSGARRAAKVPLSGPDLADAAAESFGTNKFALLLGALAAGAAAAELRRAQ